ncbi:MAG: hypothetical protein ACFE8L_06050 [Candidatus Hodarchaeota archaeon]
MSVKKYKIGKLLLLGIILFNIAFSLSILNLNTISKVNTINQNIIYTSAVTSNTSQWLENSDFSSQESWESQIEGDNRDAVAYIGDEHGNYRIIGDSGVLSIDDPLNDTDWTSFNNPEFPITPDDYGINSDGCYVTHTWDEWVDQTRNTPSMHWKRNVTMPVNMSDYIITSVSLEAIFNATVTAAGSNPLQPHIDGIERPGDYTESNPPSVPQFGIGDSATFYVLISDVEENNVYQVAVNKTTDLGQDTILNVVNNYTVNNYTDTPLNVVPEDLLISYLTSVLENDNYNFTITLGIDIYCEDNEYNVDIDVWDLLIIRSFNLTFTFEKRIDKLTTISWSQTGAKVPNNAQITDASFNFTYSINQSWPVTSPNTEMRILINNNAYRRTIKLSRFTPTFKKERINDTDFVSLFQKNVNITPSIQLFLADTFALNQNITISIDDVYLKITYIVVDLEFYKEPWFFMLLLIIASIIGACIGGYLIAYYKVLRYPRPVRKVRKYRKSLRKTNPPTTPIVDREKAFKGAYKRELAAVATLAKVSPAVQKPVQATAPKQTPSTEVKSKALEEKIEQDKLIEKSLEKKEELDKLVEKVEEK